MSHVYKQFTIQLTLQHVASVKICQTLYRNERISGIISRRVNRVVSVTDQVLGSRVFTDLFPEISPIVHQNINAFNIPSYMKLRLEYYSRWMIHDMVHWLTDIKEDMYNRMDKKLDDKMSSFINHLSWDHFGFVDCNEMLRFYVNHQDTIDYDIWRQLSEYCVEDCLRQYHEQLSELDQTNFNRFASFWSSQLSDVNEGEDESRRTGKVLFRVSIAQGNFQGVKYFHHVNAARNLDISRLSMDTLQDLALFTPESSHIYAYLAGQMTDTQIEGLQLWDHPGNFRSFIKWPWFILIDSWEKIIRIMRNDIEIWELLFAVLLSFINTEENAFHRKMNFKYMPESKYLVLFKEMWTFYYNNVFSHQPPLIDDSYRLIIMLIEAQRIQLCLVMLDMDIDERTRFFNKISNSPLYPKLITGDSVSQEFYNELCEFIDLEYLKKVHNTNS